MTRCCYLCRKAEECRGTNGIKFSYDGSVLIVTFGRTSTAITATTGEEFVFTVTGDSIECEMKKRKDDEN